MVGRPAPPRRAPPLCVAPPACPPLRPQQAPLQKAVKRESREKQPKIQFLAAKINQFNCSETSGSIHYAPRGPCCAHAARAEATEVVSPRHRGNQRAPHARWQAAARAAAHRSIATGRAGRIHTRLLEPLDHRCRKKGYSAASRRA